MVKISSHFTFNNKTAKFYAVGKQASEYTFFTTDDSSTC